MFLAMGAFLWGRGFPSITNDGLIEWAMRNAAQRAEARCRESSGDRDAIEVVGDGIDHVQEDREVPLHDQRADALGEAV